MQFPKCGWLWKRCLAPSAAVTLFMLWGETAAQVPDSVSLSAIRDNTLYEDGAGSFSNGMGSFIFTGRVAAGGQGLRRRAVLSFDLSSIPPEATLTSVDLQLYMNKSIAGPTNVSAHRLLADWGEGASDDLSQEGRGALSQTGDATWIHRFYFDSLWSTPGGDFIPSASATTSVAGLAPYHWTGAAMLADAEFFRQHPDSNFGWIIIGREDTLATAKRFGSRTNVTPSQQPVLHIYYTLPCPILKTGDVNTDGILTSADIIGLVNYVFKGGATPQPCEATADVNCSGSVTSADIISMVNHVFKGGAAPCDVCTLIPGTWSCP